MGKRRPTTSAQETADNTGHRKSQTHRASSGGGFVLRGTSVDPDTGATRAAPQQETT